MKSCCVISWDKEKRVCGLRIRRRGSKYLLEKEYIQDSDNSDNSFIEQLEAAYKQLECRDCDFIALTGTLPGALWLEFTMPDLPFDETLEALEYELQQRLPLPYVELIWRCRKIGRTPDGKAIIRVFAAKHAAWDILIEELESAAITADAFISPFMAAGPDFSDENIYLPTIDDKFYFSTAAEHGCRQMELFQTSSAATEYHWLKSSQISDKLQLSSDNLMRDERFLPALLVADYILSGQRSREDANFELPLPQSLKPSRLKILKQFTIFTVLTAIFFISMLLMTNWLNAYKRYERIAEKISDIQSRLDTVKQHNKKLHRQVKLQEKIFKAIPPSPQVLQIICELSRKLPPSMWITSYRASGSNIYITIKSSSESNHIQNKLRSSSHFSLENFRSRRNLDGTYYFYLQLKTKDEIR